MSNKVLLSTTYTHLFLFFPPQIFMLNWYSRKVHYAFSKASNALGKYIHNSLRSSHLKSKEQSPHSFLSSLESKCYLLLFPLSKCLPTSQTYEVLPYVFIPVIPPCLKWKAFFSNLLFPDFANTPILLPRSSWRSNSGKPSPASPGRWHDSSIQCFFGVYGSNSSIVHW